MTVVCATNEGIYARCKKLEHNLFRYEWTIRSKTEYYETDFNREDLSRISKEGGFLSYIAGTVLVLLEQYNLDPKLAEYGIHIHNYQTTLPMRKGLSSSAAICVLITKCFNEIYQLQLTMKEIMETAYKGEMKTPSHCGRMDQCVAMGSGSIALMMFDGEECNLRVLRCPDTLYFVVADLKAGKDTVKILKSLNDCFPIATSSVQVLRQ